MPAYLIAFYTHMTCVVLSISFFTVRGVWMLTDDPRLGSRFARVAPHIVDTLLLASAIALTIILNQYPVYNDWLTVKIIALVVYIVLGTIAIKRGRTKRIRAVAFVAAVGVFMFIVTVAYYHHPLGVLVELR